MILNREQSASTHKHWEIKYHSTKQYLNDLFLSIHVKTESNLADLFTKPLATVKFRNFTKFLYMPNLINYNQLIIDGLNDVNVIPPALISYHNDAINQ